MTNLDRTDVIRLLNRLGDPDDAQALAAARELDQRIKTAETSWESLLSPAPAATTATRVPPPPVDDGDDMAQIDRLLSGYTLSEDTRDILMGFKEDIAQGEFAPADRTYLRNLRDRLDKRAS